MGAEASFLKNLTGGVRLLAFLPVDERQFAPSLRQAVWLGALAGLIWLGFDRLTATGDVHFSWDSVAQLAWLALVVVCTLLLLSPAGRSPDSATLAFTAIASALPFFFLLLLPLLNFAASTTFRRWTGLAVAAVCAVYLYRLVHRVLRGSVPVAIIAALGVVIPALLVFNKSVGTRPELWHPVEDADVSSLARARANEDAMFEQAAIIDAAVARLAPQTNGKTDVFFVGVAGDGVQSVFANEVAFARTALAHKLDLRDRAIELVNTSLIDVDTPRASGASIRYALAQVARRMNVEEDVLLLFLTSHGTKSGMLSVRQPGWPLLDISPAALDEALRTAGIKWRIVIVSACYSGGFIDALGDEYSLIATAARADRKSFGCRPGRELTYFGEALLRDALPPSHSLPDAIDRARTLVSQREEDEDITPSEPQVFLGPRMRDKLAELDFASSEELADSAAPREGVEPLHAGASPQ
ncbi:MAG TPA: C13 family peptidase [Steroidobacteraceae bacterium]|nr:C13 family peptidase [Steroidobacteraceae bacterium]